MVEKIVSTPPLATLTVGTSILILLQIIDELGSFFPAATYLKYLVPFVPPFFITRIAKRINQRKAEYDFIKDAEPYMFVAFPEELSIRSLLDSRAVMISDSAVRHFNCPDDEILKMEALPNSFFHHPADRTTIVTRLIESFTDNEGHGTLNNYQTYIIGSNRQAPIPYILNSVLKQQRGKLKWQATMMKYEAVPQETL
ncbi:hypothetical protein KKI24_25870 [bacterium]|nr:hypothetical protein [bacterium]